MTWQPITCTEREALIDSVGRSYNGPAEPYGVISGHTDVGGEFGDPCVLTVWGYKESEVPLLKDIRHPAPDFTGPDLRPCEHYRWEESPMIDSIDPPVAKYRYTLTVTGNSHEEIENEILVMTRGGYLLDSHYHERDEFTVYGGTSTRVLEHVNPTQTPDAYRKALEEWFDRRKRARTEESR